MSEVSDPLTPVNESLAPRRGRHRLCPRCDGHTLDTDAYAHLLGLYLGDGFISHQRDKGVQRLSIYCDLAYDGLMDEVMDSMYRVNPGMAVNALAKSGCADVSGWWTHWTCLFPQHGPGRKHQRAIALQPWQVRIVEDHPSRFVRGLLHSDGCRSLNTVRRPTKQGVREYSYPRWFFSNRSEDIRQLCEWGLDLLGVAHRRNYEWSISVAKRAGVTILDDLVGPKY